MLPFGQQASPSGLCNVGALCGQWIAPQLVLNMNLALRPRPHATHYAHVALGGRSGSAVPHSSGRATRNGSQANMPVKRVIQGCLSSVSVMCGHPLPIRAHWLYTAVQTHQSRPGAGESAP